MSNLKVLLPSTGEKDMEGGLRASLSAGQVTGSLGTPNCCVNGR